MRRSLLHMPRVDLPSLPKWNSFGSVYEATNSESIPSIQTQNAFNQISSDPFHPFHGFGTLIISHCRMVLATRKTRNKRTIRIKSARRIARKEFIPWGWRSVEESSMVSGFSELEDVTWKPSKAWRFEKNIWLYIYIYIYNVTWYVFSKNYGPPRSPKISKIPPLAFGWYHGRSLEFQSENICTQPWVRQGIGVCSGVVKSLLLTGYPLWRIFFQMNSDKKRKATHALPGDDP